MHVCNLNAGGDDGGGRCSETVTVLVMVVAMVVVGVEWLHLSRTDCLRYASEFVEQIMRI